MQESADWKTMLEKRRLARQTGRHKLLKSLQAPQQFWYGRPLPPAPAPAPTLLPESIVLERLQSIVGRVQEGAGPESVIEMFPIERRIIDERGVVNYNNDDLNAIVELLNPEMHLPLRVEEGVELQHVVRLQTGAETYLTEEELRDPDYCRPEPYTEMQCEICKEDETEIRKLFKVHYTHHDDELAICLECIFNYVRNKGIYDLTWNCFEENCKRPITEYMLYRTIYYNQTPEVLGSVPPLRMTNGNLLRDKFIEFLQMRRDKFYSDAKKLEMRVKESERLREIAEKRAKLENNYTKELRANVEARILETNTARSKVGFFNIGSINQHTMCPYCFDAVQKTEGCIYLKHVDPRTGMSTRCPAGSVDSMIAAYPPNPAHNFPEWCEICGRPCRSAKGSVHNHYSIGGTRLLESGKRYFARNRFDAESICRGAGGGGRIEYFVRVMALRDELIDSYKTGKLVIDLPMKRRIAARIQTYLGNGVQKDELGEYVGNYKRAFAIMESGAWDNVLPPAPSAPVLSTVEPETVVAAPETVDSAGIWGWITRLTPHTIVKETLGRMCKMRGGTRKIYRKKQMRKTLRRK